MALREDEALCVSDRELEACIRAANPLNDALFKYLFASKENKENLLRLLNDTLGPERCIVDVEYLDRESDARRFEGRSSFVDVLAARRTAVFFTSRSSFWTRAIFLSVWRIMRRAVWRTSCRRATGTSV